MPRITVTLSDEANEWVEKEHKARGCSKSGLLANLVDQARTEEHNDAQSGESGPEKRLEELEERVTALEQACIGLHQNDAEVTQEDAGDDAEAHQDEVIEQKSPLTIDLNHDG